jgi:hypothetical protein
MKQSVKPKATGHKEPNKKEELKVTLLKRNNIVCTFKLMLKILLTVKYLQTTCV